MKDEWIPVSSRLCKSFSGSGDPARYIVLGREEDSVLYDAVEEDEKVSPMNIQALGLGS